MKKTNVSSDEIVDAALSLAKKNSWEHVRLFDIAKQLKVSLDDIHHYFREKNELVSAFFDRADKAMLAMAGQPEIKELNTPERLHKLLMSWFQVLQANRSVARQMLGSQLEIGHIHVQFLALLRVSRTVQWWREAAQRSATYSHRAIEETGLTIIFLMTMTYWLCDNSKEAQNTSQFLQRKLARARCLKQFTKDLCHLGYSCGAVKDIKSKT
ncbi:bacterial regulatory protein [Legionella lansingensis]|uniref:TetR family transporter regulatory protein n=1 Tax=Legionella lansingensis TaxID=45067 RepID=A0A0W0VHW2_9GAMM|nr:TetR/AcrR family transcriptional regulator [Legionella lansingensis]KTD19289.1 TetR family transporter regulatory protein [Legionella lansingensis]SNV50495.1 bacterial regulatory protein [Legionella lansingensis]